MLDDKLHGEIDLYFFNDNGQSIMQFSLNEDKDIDQDSANLIIGFITAIKHFANEIEFGEKRDILRFIRGDMELRILEGSGKVHGALKIQQLKNLKELVYLQLDELIKSIILRLENDYEEQLKEFNKKGEISFEGIDEFIKDEIIVMKQQMFISYLNEILAFAINFNVGREVSQDLISTLTQKYNEHAPDRKKVQKAILEIKSEVETLKKKYATFRNIIKKVNKDYSDVWTLFKVPLIE